MARKAKVTAILVTLRLYVEITFSTEEEAVNLAKYLEATVPNTKYAGILKRDLNRRDAKRMCDEMEKQANQTA